MPTICVLGMHRSGTSCLAGILQRYGVHLGEVFEKNPFNARGNREHRRVMQLNEALLAFNGCAWDAPQTITRWTIEHEREGGAILALLTGEVESFAGFKDPRTLLTLPFWEPLIGRPSFVGTFRHPHGVAASLRHRNGFEDEKSFAIWEAYNERLLAVWSRAPFPLLDFDENSDTYLADAMAAAERLGLDAARGEHAGQFFTDELRHHEPEGPAGALPPSVQRLYDRLREAHADSLGQACSA